MNATELNATNVIKTSSQTENQNVAVEDGNSHSSTVNVSAAYSYLGVLTSEQGSLCEELSLAQSTLQRHIATLATDPQRAQNANQVTNDKPLLDLTTRVILRDIDLQEQIANDRALPVNDHLNSFINLVKPMQVPTPDTLRQHSPEH